MSTFWRLIIDWVSAPYDELPDVKRGCWFSIPNPSIRLREGLPYVANFRRGAEREMDAAMIRMSRQNMNKMIMRLDVYVESTVWNLICGCERA